MFLDTQMSEERLNLSTAHLLGMAYVVEEDISFDPVHIAFFRASRIMFALDSFANHVRSFLLGRFAISYFLQFDFLEQLGYIII